LMTLSKDLIPPFAEGREVLGVVVLFDVDFLAPVQPAKLSAEARIRLKKILRYFIYR